MTTESDSSVEEDLKELLKRCPPGTYESALLFRKNKDINQEEVKQIAGNTTNNVFLGSTADLQRLLQDEKDIIDVTPKSE